MLTESSGHLLPLTHDVPKIIGLATNDHLHAKETAKRLESVSPSLEDTTQTTPGTHLGTITLEIE